MYMHASSQGHTPGHSSLPEPLGISPQQALTKSVCSFLKMENHDSPGRGEGWRSLRRGGQGTCWVIWAQFQLHSTLWPPLPQTTSQGCEGLRGATSVRFADQIRSQWPWEAHGPRMGVAGKVQRRK